jgi:hypothetical protein
MIIAICLLAGFLMLIGITVTRDLIGLSRARPQAPSDQSCPSDSSEPVRIEQPCPSCGCYPYDAGVVCHRCGYCGEIIFTDPQPTK